MSYTKQILLGFAATFCLTMTSCDNSPTDSGSNNNTEPTGTVTDIDGNVYKTVKIGNQEWTVDNLRVTKYNDGSAITKITSDTAWNSCKYTEIPAYCYYDNTTYADSIKKYGALYNGYVVSPANPKKIAPTGWHVPTDAEWSIMEKYLVLNGYNWDGSTDIANDNKIAKSLAAKTDWRTYSTIEVTIGSDLTKNNSSGFSALPGGYRDSGYMFYGQNSYGYWWSVTEGDASSAYYRNLNYVSAGLYRGSTYKSFGYSVRLVRDN